MFLRRSLHNINLTDFIYLKGGFFFLFSPRCLYLRLLSGHLGELHRECPGCLQDAQTAFEVDDISESVLGLLGVQECVEGRKKRNVKVERDWRLRLTVVYARNARNAETSNAHQNYKIIYSATNPDIPLLVLHPLRPICALAFSPFCYLVPCICLVSRLHLSFYFLSINTQPCPGSFSSSVNNKTIILTSPLLPHPVPISFISSHLSPSCLIPRSDLQYERNAYAC